MSYRRRTITISPELAADPSSLEQLVRRYEGAGVSFAHADQAVDADSDDIAVAAKLRPASLFPVGEAQATIVPTPVYDPPLTAAEAAAGTGRAPSGYEITLYWPEAFLAEQAKPSRERKVDERQVLANITVAARVKPELKLSGGVMP